MSEDVLRDNRKASLRTSEEKSNGKNRNILRRERREK